MSETFRFIHASDLHLGSFLNINGKPQEKLQELCKAAVYDGFERICLRAILLKVDFILICGDVYDSHLRSVRGNKIFIDQCADLGEKNISVYVIYGNHDVMNGAEELFALPPNLHIISCEKTEMFEVYKEDKVIAKIIGKSYKHRSEKEKSYEKYFLDNDVFNIAMLHTSLEGDNKNYIPCTLNDLKSVPNIDYWALGHIHKQSVINDTRPIVVFPGIPQGRDMGEQGACGVYYVEVCKKDVMHMEFLPISTVVYKKVEIIIEDDKKIQNYSDLLLVINEELSSLAYEFPEIPIGSKSSNEELLDDFKGYIIRLVIRGKTDMHNKITNMTDEDYKQLLENINEEISSQKYFIWVDSIIFRTSMIQNFEELRLQNSIFNDLEEVIGLYTTDSELKNELVKNWGLIWKKQIFTENVEADKFDVDEETILDIISQARELLIEKLTEVLEIM
ncbi:DNA repair exonuclease [Clostridium estertheticum]|uniref:metallophosphoesterase family protein n=1 Tax=Clostridium estertheticum TaxID=238834 RepID=UPI001C7D8D6F|nr:DNA repair exonuclease [Clostridium estertheticum]MBX4258812.1 DNA repair exonuclease [Clostridium estertheticum]WLC69179.1 DNA repair exonuclease [Clostridium estertheticum]